MGWRDSLIRISNFKVEELQKRLKEIEDRREAALLVLDALDLEAEEEKLRAKADPSLAWCHPDYVKGWKVRRARVEADVRAITAEAEGARDALSEAFEELKKVEHAEELAREAAVKEALRRENAALDDIALRQSTRPEPA
jgi:flagellar FliJ protein